MTEQPEPLLFWLTDRSRYESGTSFCPRDRFLEYHAGANGYGWRRKAESIPLATGTRTHEPITDVLGWVRDHDQLPPDEVVRDAVAGALIRYRHLIETRGLALTEGDRLEQIIAEQSLLIEGLTWAFIRCDLPWVLSERRVVLVEEPCVSVLGCTCGLGDRIGTPDDHAARACDGIGWQSRGDFVTEYRSVPGTFAYEELKTTGYIEDSWATSWETKTQFLAGVLGAEEVLSAQRQAPVRIDQAFVHGLYKGKRDSEYNPETGKRDGAPYQNSILCYGYRRPSPGPGVADDWAASFNYVDEQGRARRLTKEYKRTAISEVTTPAGMSASEYWCKWLPTETLGQTLRVIGPLRRQEEQIEGFIEELVGEENRWKAICWELYQVREQIEQTHPRWGYPDVWASAEYQSALRQLVPRSWACRRFGQRYECQMAPICFGREGWADPIGSGRYVERRPHHAAEERQAVSRGLLLPEDDLAEEMEES